MTQEADYDGAWKEALETYLPDCLALLFPRIHQGIDWTQPPEFLDNELRQVARGEEAPRVVDKLIKVRERDGGEAWVLLHVEVQHQQMSDFAARMFRYYTRIWDHFNQSVASVAILGDDHSNWRPGQYQQALWGCTATFQFPTVKLLDYRRHWSQLAGSTNPFAGVVMAHLRALETSGNATLRRQEKLALVRWLYGRGYEAEEVRRLFRFIDWLLLLPREAEQAFLTDVHAFEEEAHMPYVVSYERLALEEGERKGQEQGMRQGLRQGREEGLQLGERRGLLLGIEPLLSIKFGEAGEHAFEEIRQIEDVAVLEAIVQRLRTATSLNDVRALYQASGA